MMVTGPGGDHPLDLVGTGSGPWGRITCDKRQAVDSGCHVSGSIQNSICRNQLLALTHDTAAHLLQYPLHLANPTASGLCVTSHQ